jgi:integrase
MPTIESRITASGKLHYRAKIRLPSCPPESRTFASRKAAQTWAQQTEAALREQQQAPQTHRHSVREMISRYREQTLPNVTPGTARWREAHLRWWESRLGHLPLGALTPAHLAECRDDLARSRGPRTTRGYLETLGQALRMAVDEWLWLERSPMASVQLPKEPPGRVRFLSDDERERLLLACRESHNPDLFTITLLRLLTGCRKSELLSLRWSQVDFKRALIHLETSKNGDARSIPLVEQAIHALREHGKVRRLNSQWLFPRADGKAPIDIRYSWHQAFERAEVNDFKFHDLRHSCASALAASGASLLDIAQILGHRQLAMTQRYAHLSEGHVRATLERMADVIFASPPPDVEIDRATDARGGHTAEESASLKAQSSPRTVLGRNWLAKPSIVIEHHIYQKKSLPRSGNIAICMTQLVGLKRWLSRNRQAFKGALCL